MSPTDVRVIGAELYFLPIETRTPLKFGSETLTSVTCARARVIVADREGRQADGWGETPLSVQWAWPSDSSYADRHEAMQEICRLAAREWSEFEDYGHALELGEAFMRGPLARIRERVSQGFRVRGSVPLLASLVCNSPFDIAVHDAYARLVDLPVYETYGPAHLNRDLSYYLTGAPDSDVDFRGRYPVDFLRRDPHQSLRVWHAVGGLDPLTAVDPVEVGPGDGHPYFLDDWIASDGLECLKIKLTGAEFAWDYERVMSIARLAMPRGVRYLTVDFNCTVRDPNYVNRMLDRWRTEEPSIFDAILYVEQPFPHDIETHLIDVHSVAERKPLLMDESAHSWSQVRLGRSLGWNGVALKTCKTQTGALLSLCWAKAHDMHVMVQDLTNPMLAQIPHVLLAAHADTMMGVESNAMQFYPDASTPEAAVHPGLYQRRKGCIELSSLRGAGFGYRLDEIARSLPTAAANHLRGR